MQPTGPQIARLQDALLSAYPTESTLRQMVRIHLDASLDAVVPLHRQNQSDIVFDLIECYAAKPGGLHVLIKAAVAGNEGNPALAALAPEFLAIPFDPKPVRKQGGDILWVNVPPKPAAPLLGRDDLIADLLARLTAGHSPALSTDGLPGVGKTALAVALAHDARVRQALPDGVLWGGLGTNPDVVTVQNQWAAALGVELADEPEVHRRAERLSAVLGNRRVLVVIDDAWTIEAAQALRLSSPHTVHLLTTRDRTIARAFAGAGQQVHVPELAAVPAFALLERLAHEACAADPDAARALVQTVGELPLALEVLGGYLAGHDLTVFPDLAPEAFAALGDARQRLALATERLGGQPGKKESMEAAIRLSVEALPPEAATTFWSLGAFAPKPATFDRAAAQAVTQAEPGTLAQLVGRNLVDAADGVLAVHQVVHDVMAGETPAEAVERHRAYYLDLVNEAREDWQRTEAVYEQVRFAGTSDNPIEFVETLATYQMRRGIWSDRLDWLAVGLKQAQEAGNASNEALILNEYGYVYIALGERQQALNYFEQALSQSRQGGDIAHEARILNNIGYAYYGLGVNLMALAFYEQALPIHRQLGDEASEATTLNNIGLVHYASGDMLKAQEYYDQALPLIRQLGDKSGEAKILNNIGLVYSTLGDKPKALGCYEQALPLQRQVGDKAHEATTLNNIGRLHNAIGDLPMALGYYEQALALARQVRDKTGEATTLYNIGQVYSTLSDNTKALDFYEQALVLIRQVGDKSGEAAIVDNIGQVYSVLGDKLQALGYCAQALALSRQVSDKAGEAATLNNIGQVYSALGDNTKALDFFEQALVLIRQVGGKAGEATALNNIGAVYHGLGKNGQALSCYEQALSLRRQVSDNRGEAVTLNNIAAVYSALGEKRQALAYYQQVLPLKRQLDDKSGEATTLNNIGLVLTDLGDKRQALDFYEQALSIQTQVGDRWGESVTRFNLAMVAEALGDLARAAAELEKVVAIDEAVGHPDLDSDRQALERIRQKLRNEA